MGEGCWTPKWTQWTWKKPHPKRKNIPWRNQSTEVFGGVSTNGNPQKFGFAHFGVCKVELDDGSDIKLFLWAALDSDPMASRKVASSTTGGEETSDFPPLEVSELSPSDPPSEASPSGSPPNAFITAVSSRSSSRHCHWLCGLVLASLRQPHSALGKGTMWGICRFFRIGIGFIPRWNSRKVQCNLFHSGTSLLVFLPKLFYLLFPGNLFNRIFKHWLWLGNTTMGGNRREVLGRSGTAGARKGSFKFLPKILQLVLPRKVLIRNGHWVFFRLAFIITITTAKLFMVGWEKSQLVIGPQLRIVVGDRLGHVNLTHNFHTLTAPRLTAPRLTAGILIGHPNIRVGTRLTFTCLAFPTRRKFSVPFSRTLVCQRLWLIITLLQRFLEPWKLERWKAMQKISTRPFW